jgi:hypothetical protein
MTSETKFPVDTGSLSGGDPPLPTSKYYHKILLASCPLQRFPDFLVVQSLLDEADFPDTLVGTILREVASDDSCGSGGVLSVSTLHVYVLI